MSNRTLIQDELQTVAPGLVNLPATMPYTVPQDYFTMLALNLLTATKTGDSAMPFLPKEIKMLYTVPPGYFDTLAAEIVNKVSIKQTVPDGYFEALPTLLLNKVRSLEVTQELESVAPLLNSISKKPVQAVSDGYFENWQPVIEQLIVQQPPVVPIKKKDNWLKYAAAACVALMLSFGTYQYFGKTDQEGYAAATPEQVRVLDKQLAQLDKATIESYLQENESLTEVNANWYKNIQEDDIEDLLHDFTDQELQQQLKEMTDLPAITK